jgi:hypothetical protein
VDEEADPALVLVVVFVVSTTSCGFDGGTVTGGGALLVLISVLSNMDDIGSIAAGGPFCSPFGCWGGGNGGGGGKADT